MDAGTLLGPYRIDSQLGSGGMGTVYAATVVGGESAADGADGARVALKVVHPHLLEGGEASARFAREVEIGMTVDHENVVRTFDGGELDGHHYLAMEYVEGQTLGELLAELDRVPEELCRHIGREVTRGLGAIHAAGAIHRDMKPENVLITADHVVKIMDLGVARSTDDALRLSQTGAFVGSLHYAAPEQFTGGGKGLDARADLHALGLVLYELATASNPYYADDIPQTVRKVLHEEPRRLGEVNPQLSAFFEEVVHCLLAKDREERFADAVKLLAVLDEGEDSTWWCERAAALQLETARPIRRVRIPRETAVYGREAELAKLRALYERAKAGDGNVVLIEGEAGIGKSRLVDELIGQLQRDGEQIDFLFGSYPPGGAATAAGAFSTAYREQFGAAGSAAYMLENQILVPAFDALLRGDTTPKDAAPLTKDSLQTCFVRATHALAEERVVVVLIDDLHFAPDEGRALFTSLAMGVPGHRVLLVGTTRPSGEETWQAGLTRLAQTSHLELSRLGPKDLVHLLEDALQSDRLAQDLAGQIAVKSDGNPFFVFEIVAGLREGQFITQSVDGSWVSTGVIEEIQIPSSVMDLIEARIADLSEEEKELLEVGACCGFAFDPGLVAEAVGLRRIPALRAFGRIEKSHRLIRSAGKRYVFDHHQVQEALYAGLFEGLREEYHAAIAEAIEERAGAATTDPKELDGALCVDLCDHYLQGGRGAAASRYLERAQLHLRDGYLNAEMVALTDRALAVPGLLDGSERGWVLQRLCGTLTTMARHQRQVECAAEAERLADEAGDDLLRMASAGSLGIALWLCLRHDEALAAQRRSLEAARRIGDRKGEARAISNIGNVYSHQDRKDDAREQHERALAIHTEIGNRMGVSAALTNLGLILEGEGRFAESQDCAERSLAIALEIDDRDVVVSACGNLSSLFCVTGRLALAREYAERQFAVSREMGLRIGESRATTALGLVLMAEGRYAEARTYFERSLVLDREIGARRGEAIVLHNLGNAAFEEGDVAAAEEYLLACIALAREIEFRHLEAATHLALGMVRLASGGTAGACESLGLALELAAALGAHNFATTARCALACLPDGDPADALEAFAEHGDRLHAEELPTALWMLWRATGDRAHLAEAKRQVDAAVADVDEETRGSMLTNSFVNRGILAAWEEHGGV